MKPWGPALSIADYYTICADGPDHDSMMDPACHGNLLWLREPLQKTATVGARCLHGMGVCPWHDLWPCHLTSCRTGQHATESGWPWLRGSCSPAAPRVRLQPSACAPARAKPCRPHTADTPAAAFCLAVTTMLAWLARRWRQPLPADSRTAGMAAAGTSSPVTRWASVADHRRSFMRAISSGGPWGRRRHVYPGVCPAPLQWPARHTPQDALMLPALCASTDGTRGRPHRGWGVCARTLRQRPAGRRLRKLGIAMTVRPAINGAYLVWHHVLLHPIRPTRATPNLLPPRHPLPGLQ